MSDAMKIIVGNYARLGNVEALNELRDHRARLLTTMRFDKSDAFDVSFVTDILERDIAIIDEGLATLAEQPPDGDGEG